MKAVNIILMALVAVVFCFSQLNAQTLHENMNSSGGSLSGIGGSASQSVGQVFYTIPSGAGGSANQGIQQPFEISIVTETKEAIGISLKMIAYPNPTIGLLKLRIDDLRFNDLMYQLFDASGKLLESGNVSGTETDIDLISREPAVYFLKVLRKSEDLKTYKIVRTH
ncbi:MAG: T9SS type A sorting domain-containing protein [Lentimicrobium sp.]|nr:T9SS type A sorting domain-containing protein [Lentimicrobium sp.]